MSSCGGQRAPALALALAGFLAGSPGCRTAPETRPAPLPAELNSLPGHDAAACAEGLRERYTGSRAYQDGIQGSVVFRITLDPRGKIIGLHKIQGLRTDIDEMAARWLLHNPRCRFSGAVATDGSPVEFVIERYAVVFEIS